MMPSPEQLQSFRSELDALRAEYLAKIGEDDAAYIRSVRTVARVSRLAGRLLIHFSLDPVSWAAGVLALGGYKILENMEIGHNVLHGQYNFMKDPGFSSRDYEWDMVATSESWKRSHNAIHHAFTNVIGRDADFGYNAFRFSAEVPWNPLHLFQAIISPVSGLIFEYSIGAYDLGLIQTLLPAKLRTAALPRPPLREVVAEASSFLKKAGRQIFVDYLFYPALAGPFAAKVLAGNLAANLLRNGWAYAVIYCGHLTEDAAAFRAEDIVREDKAHWYLRQVMGTSNFEMGRIGHILSGHLGFQIEHHLFPNIPAWRYPAMARRVRAICDRHGVAYHTGRFGAQFLSALRRLLRFSVPRRAVAPPTTAQIPVAAAV